MNLTETVIVIDSLDRDLQGKMDRVESADRSISDIEKRYEALLNAAKQLAENATFVKELDVAGESVPIWNNISLLMN